MKIYVYNGLAFVWFVMVMVVCSFDVFKIEFGMVIIQFISFEVDILVLLSDMLDCLVFVIEGEGFMVDFGGIFFWGSLADSLFDIFIGLLVFVCNSKNVIICNFNVWGYKVVFMVENIDSFLLEDCDFSYNYWQWMKSILEVEDFSDWFYYYYNELDEWLCYGVVVYFKGCDVVMVCCFCVIGG